MAQEYAVLKAQILSYSSVITYVFTQLFKTRLKKKTKDLPQLFVVKHELNLDCGKPCSGLAELPEPTLGVLIEC